LAAAIMGLAAACGAVSAAQAGPARIRFDIEPKPYAEALLDIAQQANVTLIGAAACSGSYRQRLIGVLTLEEALDRLLAEAPCSAKVVAPGAVEVSALAQSAPARPPPPVVVSELLVTATKRIRNPRELAVAVTAIPRGQLKDTGSTDASEAAGQLAGVLATNLGPGRNKLLLRGLSDGAYTGRARSVVATYLDDLPLNYNAPDPDLRLVDVERVEVARGPQGALYGAGSLSGVYRIVTRKPDLTGFSSGVLASGSATRGGVPSYAAEGYVNLPLWDDAVGLRLSAYQEVQGGYLDDVILQKDNVDRTVRRGARAILLVQPNEAWTLNLTVAGQHLRSDDTHYTTPGLGRKRAVRIAEPHVNDIELVTGTIRGSWGWGEFTSSTGFVRHAYGSLYDATARQNLYTSFARTSAYSERTRTRMLVQDLFLTSRGASRFEWLAGIYGSSTSEHSPTEFLAQNPGAPNVLVYGDDRRDRIRELATYGEASYELAPSWTLAVGGRIFNIRARTRSQVVSEREAPRAIDRTRNFTSFSPKISLQRAFGPGDLVYAVVSEGYRAGGVNSGGARPLSVARETFSPDRLRNYEVGLKLETMSKRLSLNSAVFYDVWKDIQSDQFRSSGIPYTTNAGDAHVLGLETELAYRGANGFSAQLNGRLSRTRTTNANPDFTLELADGRLADELPGAPAVSGGVLLSYEREIFDDWIFRLAGQAVYMGRSRVTFDSTFGRMDGYARTKLSAELAAPNFGVQVYVVNPLDSFNDTFAFGNPFNPDRIRQITPQRPITVGVTLSASL
jgi:outer membrane receptor protein involved in Fe transport